MTASFRLDGRVALVTGATTGLGHAIAQAFAAAGAIVAVHGRDAARTRETAGLIPNARPIVFDINDHAGAESEIAALIGQLGRLDILVANAGIRDRRGFLSTTTEAMREVLETNLTANFRLAQLVAPRMIELGGGRIIFMSSHAASRGAGRGSSYAASKGGLVALMRALAVELGQHNICVNALSPGYFATEYNEALSKEPGVAERVDLLVPLKRWAAPAELTGPALLLASDAGSYINGHVLTVDGGLLAAN
jgi:gluconate 5-dehydrogenase